jgi:hypothetical protein
MDPLRLNLKLFVTDAPSLRPAELAPIFHGWIQRRELAPDLLIDVADYSHVADGPGVVLIAHEGHYAFDALQGQLGFSYSLRRAKVAAGFEPALRYGLRQLLTGVNLLLHEPSLQGRLQFDMQRLKLQINDRLRAPNRAETWAELRPEAQPALGAIFDTGVRVEADPPGLGLFTLQVKSPKPFTPSELLAAVAPAP